MLRWSWNGLAALSPVLFVVLTVLWVRSYTWTDVIHCRWETGTISCGTPRGVIGLFAEDHVRRSAGRPRFEYDRIESERWSPKMLDLFFPHHLSWAGFAWAREGKTLLLAVPFWFLLIASASPSALWLAAHRRRRRRRRRRRLGLCGKCGYDLRATPEGGGALLGRCPECGTVPPAKGKTT